MSRKRKNEDASSTNEASSNSKKSGSKAKPNISVGQAATLIRRGEIDKLKEIIDEGRILNIHQSISQFSNRTLLTIACEFGSFDSVKLLVENNATINNEAAQGELLASIINGSSIEILKYLLERGLAFDDRCLLHSRSFIKMTGSNPMFSLLVDQITDVNLIDHDSTFLTCASAAGNLTLVQLLLERGAVRTALVLENCDALGAAAQSGHADIVTLLLNWNRAEAPIAAEQVALALSAASFQSHLDVVRVLVAYGVDNAALNLALYRACEGYGDAELVTYLLDNGTDVNLHHDGSTPLACVCINGTPDLAELLLTRGADPNLAAPDGGLRPLDAASLHYEVMKVLLEHGANPNLPFDGDRTALLEALRSDDVDDKAALLTVLLEHEADPNKADPETGETPLMIAALAVEVDLVKLLLEHGADVTQVDRDGRAVLDMLGRTRKYGPVVELCEQYIECNKPGAKAVLK